LVKNQMNQRRIFLKTLGIGILSPSLECLGKILPKAEKRPNIVFMIADDWSWPHAGILGDPVVKTPAFDRIAKEGVLFQNAFTVAPSCTPSRAAILTGKYHWRLQGAANLWGSLPKDVTLYTDLLKTAGYHVGHTGKGYWPTNNLYHQTNIPCYKRYRGFAQFMKERKKNQPIAFWLGGVDPHRPYEKNAGVKSGMDINKVKVPASMPDVAAVRSDICDYFWEVQRFDSHCGEVIKYLGNIGELDDTLIFMTSDNGMPFPRCKTTLYDMGTHMPLAIRWGKNIVSGRTVDDFVSLCDVTPTILEAAGLNIPEVMTGRSLMNILRSKKNGTIEKNRTYVLGGIEKHCYPNPCRSIRTKDYLYIRNYYEGEWPIGEGEFDYNIDPSPSKSYMMEHKEEHDVKKLYELAFLARPKQELYDLKKDPDQLNNVAEEKEYARFLKQMDKMLTEKLKESDDPRIYGKGYLFEEYKW